MDGTLSCGTSVYSLSAAAHFVRGAKAPTNLQFCGASSQDYSESSFTLQDAREQAPSITRSLENAKQCSEIVFRHHFSSASLKMPAIRDCTSSDLGQSPRPAMEHFPETSTHSRTDSSQARYLRHTVRHALVIQPNDNTTILVNNGVMQKLDRPRQNRSRRQFVPSKCEGTEPHELL